MSDIPGINLRLPQLEEIRTMIAAVLEGRPRQSWYTAEQAWRLKYAAVINEGAISLDTFKKTRALQPRGGVPDSYQSGKKAWSDQTIQAWLPIGDDDLPRYLEECCAGAVIPDRIFEAIKRRKDSERRLQEAAR